MKNDVMVFTNAEFGSVRTIEIDNKPYFVGKDVADILGYTNTRKALTDHVDDEDRGVAKCDTLGGVQNLSVINESGLYSLIFGCKLPKAKEFKRWVTSEVLPEIRKTGNYSNGNENIELVTITPEMASKLLENNFNNRPINNGRVKALAKDMAIGKWEVNGETIKIYEDGTLSDGQHRLSACVKANVPFETYIVRNVSKNALTTIDCGEKRSLVHGLQMKGIEIDAKLVPCFNLLFNKSTKLTSAQVEFIFTKYNNECKLVTNMLPRSQSSIDFRGKTAFRAFCIYLLIIQNFSKDELKDFVDGMGDKPNCVTNFDQTGYNYRKWYERNIWQKNKQSCGSFSRSNYKIKEFDSLLQCLVAFKNNRIVKTFRDTGRAMCELEQCNKFINRQFQVAIDCNEQKLLTV